MPVYVTATDEIGRVGAATTDELDGDSFRAFMVDTFIRAGMLHPEPGYKMPILRTKGGVRLT